MRRNPRATVLLGVALAAAVTVFGQNPAPKPTTATSSTNLARCIPRDGLLGLLEYHGTDAHKDAWDKTSARKILVDTPAGAMLEDLLRQFLEGQLAQVPPENRPSTGPELTSVFKHIATNGVLFAWNLRPAPQRPSMTIIFPGALRDDTSKKVFGPIVRSLTAGGAKPEPSQKPGGRSVITVSRNGVATGPTFWKENNSDLIITDDPDGVIAAIDGKSPSAAASPLRKELFAAESDCVLLGAAMIDVAQLPQGPSPMANSLTQAGIDPKSIKRLEYRLGLRGADLSHEIRLVTTSPRTGSLALLDGPKFEIKSLPALPAGVTEFTAFSLDLSKIFGQLAEIAKTSGPDAAAMFSGVEDAVNTKTKLRLREDIFGRLGPRMIFYKVPSKAGAGAGLLGMLGSGGLQVPKGALLVEIKDPKGVTAMLDSLMAVANKEFKTRAASAVPPTDAEKGATRPGTTPRTKSSVSKADVPEFKVTLNNPKTYSLNLPMSVGAMTNLRLTIVVGKKTLVIATMPEVTREALAVESKASNAGGKGLASEAAKVIQGMPPGMTVLNVSDPRSTLPEGLANLPTTLSAMLNPPGPPPAAGNKAAAPPVGTVSYQVDPANIPKAEAIRPLVGLSATALATDKQSIRLIVRHSFPDIGAWIAIPATARTLQNGPGALKPPGNNAPPGAPANEPKKPAGGGGTQIN